MTGPADVWQRLADAARLDELAHLLVPAVRALSDRLDEHRAGDMVPTVARLGRFPDLLIDFFFWRGRRSDAAAVAESLNGLMGDRLLSHFGPFPGAAGRLGDCFVRLERYEEAEQLLRAGRRAILDTLPPGHNARQTANRRLVRLYDAWAKPKEAAVFRSLLGENSEESALSPL